MKAFISSLTILATLTACGGGGGGGNNPATPDTVFVPPPPPVLATSSSSAVSSSVASSATVSSIASSVAVSSSAASSKAASSVAIPVPNVYSMQKLSSTDAGIIYSTKLTGADSNGTAMIGSLAMGNGEARVYQGILITTQELVLIVGPADKSVAASTSISQTYKELFTGYSRQTYSLTSNVTCVLASPSRLPDTMTPGDVYVNPSIACDDGTTQITIASLVDAGNGNARLVGNSTMKKNGVITSTVEQSFTITKDGTILAFNSIVTIPNTGYTMILNSTK